MRLLGLIIFTFSYISCSTIQSGHFFKVKSTSDSTHEDHGHHSGFSEIDKKILARKRRSLVFIPQIKPKLIKLGDTVDYTRSVASAHQRINYDYSFPLDEKTGDRLLQFTWPLEDNYRVTSGYGKRKMGHKKRMHKGIDIGAKKGTPILAAESGKIIYSGWMGSYGNVTIIEHTADYHSVYAHASRNLKSKGDIVSRGEIIAKVGSTGRSTGNHLHFEIRFANKAMNPADYYQDELVSR